MLTDGLMIALLVSLLLSGLALKLKSNPVCFIAALGWLISGFQVYQQTTEVLPMALLMMVAVCQFFLVKTERA